MPSAYLALNVGPMLVGAIMIAATVLVSLSSSGNPGLIVSAFLLAWFGLGIFCGGAAMAFDMPQLYCKGTDGKISPLAWVHLGGWLVLYRGQKYLKIALGKCGFKVEKAGHYSLIAPRIILGGIQWELPLLPSAPEVNMVVDMTCEWTEPAALRNVREYVCVPVVDTTLPKVSQTMYAARRVVEFLKDPDAGSVYIHCTNGRSRSALVACTVLMLDGTCNDPEEAKQRIGASRSSVKLASRVRTSMLQDVAVAIKGESGEGA